MQDIELERRQRERYLPDARADRNMQRLVDDLLRFRLESEHTPPDDSEFEVCRW